MLIFTKQFKLVTQSSYSRNQNSDGIDLPGVEVDAVLPAVGCGLWTLRNCQIDLSIANELG